MSYAWIFSGFARSLSYLFQFDRLFLALGCPGRPSSSWRGWADSSGGPNCGSARGTAGGRTAGRRPSPSPSSVWRERRTWCGSNHDGPGLCWSVCTHTTLHMMCNPCRAAELVVSYFFWNVNVRSIGHIFFSYQLCSFEIGIRFSIPNKQSFILGRIHFPEVCAFLNILIVSMKKDCHILPFVHFLFFMQLHNVWHCSYRDGLHFHSQILWIWGVTIALLADESNFSRHIHRTWEWHFSSSLYIQRVKKFLCKT